MTEHVWFFDNDMNCFYSFNKDDVEEYDKIAFADWLDSKKEVVRESVKKNGRVVIDINGSSPLESTTFVTKECLKKIDDKTGTKFYDIANSTFATNSWWRIKKKDLNNLLEEKELKERFY